MAGLVANLLDFARGRLGGGFPLSPVVVDRLGEILHQVVSEVQDANPGREIERRFALRHPVVCDPARISQLLSNLLANAMAHGAAEAPVTVRAGSDENGFELAVTNQGEPIPEELASRLFHPFYRATVRPGQEGLGLGLYIASEIARAHGGTLEVESGAAGTTFLFRMPVRSN